MVYAAGEAGACLQQLKSLAGAATSANTVCEFDNHNVTQNPMCISESHVHFIWLLVSPTDVNTFKPKPSSKLALHRDRRGVEGFDDATDLITTLSVDAANVLNLVVAPAVGNPESPGGGWPRLHARLEGVVLYDMRSMQRRYLHGVLPP
jgi:hypothetical protein